MSITIKTQEEFGEVISKEVVIEVEVPKGVKKLISTRANMQIG